MSRPSPLRSPKGRRVKGDYAQGPYFSQNAPMEVYDGSGYRPDPALHSTPTDPGMPKPAPQEAPLPAAEAGPGDERNRILTSPLPMVVSAPEAIEKMERLNELVQEGRPDLASEAQAVAQALDTLERKALGEKDFATHEAGEGHNPATGLPAPGAQQQAQAPQFAVGDRVVVALDDGDYQGEVQKDNGDGTYDVKTDQMATFRRVPAESIAKPEMLQPVASGEPRMKKPPRRKAKASAIKAAGEDLESKSVPELEALIDNWMTVAMPGATGEDTKKLIGDRVREAEAILQKKKKAAAGPKASKLPVKVAAKHKVKADFMEKQIFESDGVMVDLKDGSSAYLPEEVYGKGNETPDGVRDYVEGEPVTVEKIHGWFARFSAPGYMDRTDWVFDETEKGADDTVEEYYGIEDEEGDPEVAVDTEGMPDKGGKKVKGAPAVAEKPVTSPDINTSPDNAAVQEGYSKIEGIKVVEEGGKPRAFKDTDDTVPAEVYANAEGQLALVGPDGANYEADANDQVEADYWKTVHGMIPKAEGPKAEGDKAAENVAKWAEKAGVAAKKVKAGIKRLPSGRWKDTNGNSYATVEEAAEAEAAATLAEHDPKADPDSEESLDRIEQEKQHILENIKASEASAKKGKKAPEAAEELDAAQKLLAEHKVKADKFFVVAPISKKDPAIAVHESDLQKLRAAMAAGADTKAILGIFADRASADRFRKIVGGNKTAEDKLDLVEEELENADDAVLHTRMEIGENPHLAKDAADSIVRDAREAARIAREAKSNIEGAQVVASGVKSELAKDPTFAVVLAGLSAKDDAIVEIVASKDGVVTARLKAASGFDDSWFAEEASKFRADVLKELSEMAKLGNATAKAALSKIEAGGFDRELDDMVKSGMDVTEAASALAEWAVTASNPKTDIARAESTLNQAADSAKHSRSAMSDSEDDSRGEAAEAARRAAQLGREGAGAADDAAAGVGASLAASAFDEIPELEIGGGMKARRKKGKGEKAEGAEIEVIDKDGKAIATYPDAFGDDTVLIIKFLRQVLDIKEADDKKAGKDEPKGGDSKGEKKDKKEGESAEDKPLVLPAIKEKKDSKAEDDDKAEGKKKEKAELEARAKWMESRVADCRHVVEAMMKKGHVRADQADVDAELLEKKTLRQAQEVAAKKAIDREVMRLLGKPEAELQIIKASLQHLKVLQVKASATEGGLDLANLSAGGLIHEGSKQKASLGLALTAAFHR